MRILPTRPTTHSALQYALAKAQKCGYQDRPGPLPAQYWHEVKQRCLHASKGKLPRPGRWLGGFYFNSALVRIAATREKVEGKKKPADMTPALRVVHEEVNRPKHRAKSTVMKRQVTLDEGREALTDLVVIMEKSQGAGL